jgi:phosphoribosyl 1,2-cyclic phosphodiesterase
MRIISLQSGSNGNCIFVESGETRILFDAGISGTKAQTRLAERNIDICTVDALFISHDHSDHSQNMGVLHRKFGISVWTTPPTYTAACEHHKIGQISSINYFNSSETLCLKDITIETIRTPHDASDGVFFIIDNGCVRFGIMTDLGHVTNDLQEAIKSVDALLLESNYDPELLRQCDYPEQTKRRIAGNGGHISNMESASLLKNCGKRLRWACLGHISEHSNNEQCLTATHKSVLKGTLPLYVASRHQCSDILEL